MRDLSEEAERFAIWRVGQQQDFDYTYGFVAQKTNVPLTRVKAICKARKWKFVDDDMVAELDFDAFTKNGVDLNQNHV